MIKVHRMKWDIVIAKRKPNSINCSPSAYRLMIQAMYDGKIRRFTTTKKAERYALRCGFQMPERIRQEFILPYRR